MDTSSVRVLSCLLLSLLEPIMRIWLRPGLWMEIREWRSKARTENWRDLLAEEIVVIRLFRPRVVAE